MIHKLSRSLEGRGAYRLRPGPDVSFEELAEVKYGERKKDQFTAWSRLSFGLEGWAKRFHRRGGYRGCGDTSADSGLRPATADYYDLHLQEELQDKLTFVDDEGIRRSRTWLLPRNKAELVERREHHATVSRKIGAGQFGRMPDASNTVMITLIDDPDVWEQNSIETEGRGLADNIRRFWAEAKDADFNIAPIFIDSQPDRVMVC